MSWREKLLQGTWKGVPFEYSDHSGEIGWRLQTHEYPERDTPYTENLGSAKQTLSVNCYVIGADYMSKRDALLDAFEEGSEGVLVHPRHGSQQWMLQRCVYKETAREGGKASFALTFVEPGANELPEVLEDTSSKVASATGLVSGEAVEGFAADFSLKNVPQFVTDEALALVQGGLNGLRQLNGQIAGVISPLSELANDIDAISNEVETLLLSPRSFASALVSVVASSLNAVTSVDRALNGYRSFSAVWGDTPDYGSTVARQRQKKNQDEIKHLFLSVAVAETTKAVCLASSALNIQSNEDSPFDSYDHAISIRDELVSEIQEMADVVDYPLYQPLAALRAELIRHISAHGARLERIERMTLGTKTPSLVLSHRLYGSIDRADDLTRRNKVSHPGFIPENTELEVLSG